MDLADRVFEVQEPSNETWDHTPATLERIQTRADALAKRAQDELLAQGFARDRIHLEVYLHMRYDGTDTALMTLKPADSWNMESAVSYTHLTLPTID